MNCKATSEKARVNSASVGGVRIAKYPYETGKKVTLKLFRGVGERPADPGDLGVGKYFSIAKPRQKVTGIGCKWTSLLRIHW